MVYRQKYCSLDKAQKYCKSIVHVIKHANFQFYLILLQLFCKNGELETDI